MSKSLTIIIPVYNSHDSIRGALDSIFNEMQYISPHIQVEIIVVDDGSSDGDRLFDVLKMYQNTTLVRHEANQGLNAARNTGIFHSTSDYVTILDSDDSFISGWSQTFLEIIEEWPSDSNVCFTACIDGRGNITASEPSYRGYLSYVDQLNERHSGEYLPIFRGGFIRGVGGYLDIGTRKSCGTFSHLAFAKVAPFWVTPKVLRLYNYSMSSGSLSSNWLSHDKALETVNCYRRLFETYGDDYLLYAKKTFYTKRLRFAIYIKYAGLSGYWREWRCGATYLAPLETVASFFVIVFGGSIGRSAIYLIKRMGWIRRYG